MEVRAGDFSRVLMDLRAGDRLSFGDTGVIVELVSKSGRHARLCVIAPRKVPITRSDADQVALPVGYVRKVG